MPRYDTRAHRSSTVQLAHARPDEREANGSVVRGDRRPRVETTVDEKVIRKFHRWKMGVAKSFYEYPFLESAARRP